MLSTEDIIFLIITVGELMIGLLGNGLIGLVTCIDWIKKKKLSSIDCIFISLSISRICLICVIAANIISVLLCSHQYLNKKPSMFMIIFWTLSDQLASLFGTCLNVFYLLKIANFSHPLFLWLKWKIDRAVVHILLGCLTISLLIILTLIIILNCDYQFFVIENQKINFSDVFDVSKFHLFTVLNIFGILGIVPLSVSLISLFLLIISLWRHDKQIKYAINGDKDPNAVAHVQAMKTITSFLFLLIVYYLTSIFLDCLMTEMKKAVLLGEILSILYPSVHSLILILACNRLREASAKMLICGKTNCMM